MMEIKIDILGKNFDIINNNISMDIRCKQSIINTIINFHNSVCATLT
jgi:hypothetical protein